MSAARKPPGPRQVWLVRVWLLREDGQTAPTDSWPMTRARAESFYNWLTGQYPLGDQGTPCLVGPCRAEIRRVGEAEALDPDTLPACLVSMGCLCAAHARGNAADARCDTREQPDTARGGQR